MSFLEKLGIKRSPKQKDYGSLEDMIMDGREVMTVDVTINTPRTREIKNARLWRNGVEIPLATSRPLNGAELAPKTLDEAVHRLAPGGILVRGELPKIDKRGLKT